MSICLDFPAKNAAEELETRNQVKGLARRTRKNLDHIERAQKLGADVHKVTQLVLSVLGMVVFPYEEKAFERDARLKPLDSITKTKWNIKEFPKNLNPPGKKEKKKLLPTVTLDQLLYHLRNAIAHHRNEAERLNALRRYQILDTPPEPAFDEDKLRFFRRDGTQRTISGSSFREGA